MHRSGTSVLARAMETIGADLGERLMPPAAGNNDKGFFEDLDINQVNIEILHEAGFDWDTMASIDLSSIDERRLDQLRANAARVLRTKCEGKIFALKDPRIARLPQFWQPIFSALTSRVVYAIAVRNPISVARSLSKRDNFAEEKSHILWLAHTVSALEMTAGHPRTLIGYDALLDAPRQELARISSELGLPLIESAIDSFEKEFVDSDLRHTRFTRQDLDLLRSSPRQVRELFSALDETIRSGLPSSNAMLEQAIRSARLYLTDVSPLLKYEWQLDCRSKTLNAAIASLNESVRVSEHERNVLSDELRTANLDRTDTHNRLDEARNELSATRSAVVALESDVVSMRELNAEMLSSTSWRITAPLRALKQRLTRH
ncbi:lipopolysaccharide biosynthesis protein-like protein [Burkholderia lata]|uniref:Lipopolysaccharide biosynthesis protein-like protein n=2 Tax=Burkholderia lata (strain ATCC 17760 / DSM 23089 / LMG 22485 / NCIMB 9086 / R18194 / 383) TaxID=482957 RepID=A0A6P2UN06_BURL3|nr:lipopolysaccharide biosynthesis protein-like protein [Burkholderia lata]